MWRLSSTFDGNFGGNGATLNLGFSNGKFENVTLQNHRGAVIRVSKGSMPYMHIALNFFCNCILHSA